MQHSTDFHAVTSRLLHLSDELTSGCDPDFDADYEALDRACDDLTASESRIGAFTV